MHRLLVGSQIHQQPRASPCLRKQPLSASAPWHHGPGTGAPASPHPGPRKDQLPQGTSRPPPASWRPLHAVTSAAGAAWRQWPPPRRGGKGGGRAAAMATNAGGRHLVHPAAVAMEMAVSAALQARVRPHLTKRWVLLILVVLPAPKLGGLVEQLLYTHNSSTQRAISRDCKKKKKLPKP